MKRTRGPWTKDQYGNLYGGDGERLLVSGVSLPTGNHPQAEEADGNAQLLLGADALEQALWGYVEAHDKEHRETYGTAFHDHCQCDLCEEARVALSKVRGEKG